MKISSCLNVVRERKGGGGGVIKAHKRRLCVKGEPFSGFRYVKG